MKTKASLSFAVFGISFTLAVADQVKRDHKRLSQPWNRAGSLEQAANRLLDSVAPSGPSHEDSSNAGQIFDLVDAEAAKHGIARLNEYRTAFALCIIDQVKRQAPIRSHQWNRAEALDKSIKRLLDDVTRKGKKTDLDVAEKIFDLVERDIVKLYANPKPARQRGKDGRFVSAGVAV